jgi:tRNA threonylcarbamoyladenosine biosynthesis protein TsaB
MLTLAIECATKTIGLALLKEEDLLADLYLDSGRRHAETLMPALERLLILAGVSSEDLDLLVCTVGPGSFTGLRIGASTVKGLALALKKPVVGVSTLETLAMNAIPYPGLICTMLDAGKNEVYVGLFRMRPDGLLDAMQPERLSEVPQFIQGLDQEEIVFLGDGALQHMTLIREVMGGKALLCGGAHHKLRASGAGIIGIHRYRNGDVLDVLTFAPGYLRLSGAETKVACQRS